MRSSRCPRRVMLINAAKIWKSTLASSLARLSTIMILQPSTILVNTVSLRPCSATISGYWLTRQVIDCYDGHRAELPFINVTLMRVSRRPRRVMLINAAKFRKTTGLLRRGSALPRRCSLRPYWSTQPAFDHAALQSVAAGQHERRFTVTVGTELSCSSST